MVTELGHFGYITIGKRNPLKTIEMTPKPLWLSDILGYFGKMTKYDRKTLKIFGNKIVGKLNCVAGSL